MAKDIKVKESSITIGNTIVEAGDLAKEVGKLYIQDLNAAIEDGRKHNRTELSFLVHSKKDTFNKNKINITIGVCDVLLSRMRQLTDYYIYNYDKEELKLIWTLPHKTEMKRFMREPEKYPQLIIQSIRQYLKQEGINLSKRKEEVVSLK